MSCAYRLHRHVNLTIFESEKQPGGHTHTVDAPGPDGPVPVDTGFMVYNEVTYPLLTALFKELEVPTYPTDMSFGVQFRPDNIEFCGSSLRHVFAQPFNAFRPRFLWMLRDILRFNKVGLKWLSEPDILGMTLADFVEVNRFGKAFLNYYLVPMTSAIWSTPPDAMLQFPAHTLLRFMHNHGLLGVDTHHQWRTVAGGSRTYRDKLIAPFRQQIRCGCPVRRVRRLGQGAEVVDASGERHRFDRVVLATHADTALKLLETPSVREARLLGCFPYARNAITLHTDSSVMPQRRAAWASWNYRIDALPDGCHKASTHYYMNRLQRLDTPVDHFVSVNGIDLVDRSKVIKEFSFDHPMFDKAASTAQFELHLLNEDQTFYYCGSYFRYGFHEDGLMAGLSAAERLLDHLTHHAKFAL